MDDSLDDTLTLKNVVNSIKSVNNWFELGVQLDIKYNVLQKIRNDRRDQTDSCKVEMVQCWLVNVTSSWNKLCDALENIDEGHVVRQIVDDYPDLKRECKRTEIKRREAPQLLKKLEQENTSDRIEDETHEHWERGWEKRNEQIQQKSKKSTQQTISREEEEATRDALHKQNIEWIYDVLIKSAADREELDCLKDKMEAQAERGRIFKERVKKLKERKEALCSRAQQFEEMEEYLRQDEKELEYRSQKLQKLSWLQWLAHLPDVIECNIKLIQCQDRLRRCQEQSRICSKALRCSEFQLADCHKKLESCTSELRYLQKEYERCSRTVITNMKEIEKAEPNLKAFTVVTRAAVIGATVGAMVGSAIPGPGTATGVVVGGAIGYLGGAAVDTYLERQLRSCQKELKASEHTREKCQDVAEKVKNEIDELENLTHTLLCDQDPSPKEI